MGKSTLLTLLAGLVRPTSGRVEVCGQEVSSLSERALLRLRSGQVGMVLQTPGRNVLPYATARQNVGFALRSRRWTRAERRERIEDLLGSVGLGANADDRAQVLSGGQQQRLALAIALAGDPVLLLADEPTSQLDQRTGEIVTALMLEAREARGTALVVVTHDHGVSDLLDVSYRVHDGVVEPHR